MSQRTIFPSLARLSSVMLLILLLAACASDKKQPEEEFTIDTSELDKELQDDITQAKRIFYSLPSPLETAMLIKSAGAAYNEELLNPVENADFYSTNKKRALNLGIYTTDLSYASISDQTQTTITYMEAAKKMADGLGILDAIDNTTIERLEENVNNRDVIMDIISETFMSSSSFLTENDRSALASIVLVGGWIEGLYIATQLVEDDANIENNKLVGRIVDQKLSFDIVTNLLDEHSANPEVREVIAELQDLKSSFNKVEITTTDVRPVKDEATNVTVIKSNTKVKITPETFREIKSKVEILRQKFIS